MKKQDLLNVGIPESCIAEAIECVKIAALGGRFKGVTARKLLKDVANSPASFVGDKHFNHLANRMIERKDEEKPQVFEPVPYKVWGEMDLNVKEQMDAACSIPCAVAAAVMADNHFGYGLIVGGVLALDNAVSPMAVGYDIGCRMRISIVDSSVKNLNKEVNGSIRRGDLFSEAIEKGTVFGVGGRYKDKQNHPVMDKDWNITSTTKAMKDRAWEQLGTSGSSNHFCNIGILTLPKPEFGLEPGEYVAILSHSGSRGAGAAVCKFYNDIALSRMKYKHSLSWLDMNSEAGLEYWNAMNLMGDYASANHEVIHRNVSYLLDSNILASVENFHNFSWKENYNGRELYVHRKGATPAGEGVLGVIPGTMADPAFIVRGKGNVDSLNSSSHGAGRRMSRTEARKKFNWAQWKTILKQKGVRLLSAGLDEMPAAYKDINSVIAAQSDLIDVVARFDPKIVKMSADGDKSES